MVLANLELPVEDIARLCRQYEVTQLSIFGSVLRDDFRPDSDVDFLVVFRDNNVGPWMGKLMNLEEDFSTLLGRKVDLVSKRGVLQSRNRLRQKHILDSARVIYED